MNELYNERIVAISRWLVGEPPTTICASLGRSERWFFKWLKRFKLYGLDGLKDLPKDSKHHPNQTDKAIEEAIIKIRKLREKRESDETKYALIGADAIHKELKDLGYEPPSVRTVHRLMFRNGLIIPAPDEESVCEVIDRHYPHFEITRPGQLQQLDLKGPIYLTGSGQKYYSCSLRDVCSRWVAIEVMKNRKSATVVSALIKCWQRMGTPTILQHDNGLEFRGSNRYPRSSGLLTKLCLYLGVESVFVPHKQPYRNGTTENLNGLFQRLVLKEQEISDFEQLQKESSEFEYEANTAHPHIPLGGKTSLEYENSVHYAPDVLWKDFKFDSRFKFEEPPDGKVSFIRRIRKSGRITIASEKFDIDPNLAWDYVYATIFVKEQKLKIYHQGNLIKEFVYELKV